MSQASTSIKTLVASLMSKNPTQNATNGDILLVAQALSALLYNGDALAGSLTVAGDLVVNGTTALEDDTTATNIAASGDVDVAGATTTKDITIVGDLGQTGGDTTLETLNVIGVAVFEDSVTVEDFISHGNVQCASGTGTFGALAIADGDQITSITASAGAPATPDSKFTIIIGGDTYQLQATLIP